jgi:serine/threonine protein kinase
MSASTGLCGGQREIVVPTATARDLKLDREVAIKLLPDAVARDPERLARFEREAKVLASLNHPNIAQIYSVEDRALVMELVPGKTLKGPLPLDTTLNYATQIASALQAAHDKGIVHRDLKPGNIMVTPDGVVKVLDFGLAVQNREPGSASPEDSPTLTIGATQAGVILGTAAYMSPEQASGQPVDRRSDIWSFGVVLLEMLTGERTFKGETVSHVLAAVLAKDPDLSRAPVNVQRLLKSCLQKDPKQRLQAIGDWKLALDTPGTPAALPETTARSSFAPWGWVATALALVAIPLVYVAYRHTAEEAPHVLRFTVPPPEHGVFGPNGVPQLSPDGRRIAYLARVAGGPIQLWVRDLDSLTSRLLVKETSRSPFWSPDGRSIGFWSSGKLQKMDASGGPALSLCNAPNVWGGTWNSEDVILFSTGPGSPIQRISAAGGTATPVTTLDTAAGEVFHTFPRFLPDGRHFLYTAYGTDEDKDAIYVGDLQSKTRTRVMPAKSNAVYVPPGYILFMREQTLMAQAFDAGKLRTTGDSFPIAEQVDTIVGSTRGYFTASQNGVLAYESGAQAQNLQLTWLDRSGKPVGTVGSPGDIEWATISPDGKTVAFDLRDMQTGYYDIWLHDLARGTDSRFTFNSKNNQFPVWSPDGNYLAFNSDRSGVSVYKKATNGVGQDEVVDQDGLIKRPTGWSPDGRFIVEETNAATKTRGDIWLALASPANGNEKPHPYLQTEFSEGIGKVSPNGKWLAYRSDETKRNEIYIMTFPSPGGKWQISTSGGSYPVWSRDGKQLFYVGNDKMMVVDIRGTGANPEPGVPQPLFDVRLRPTNPGFDVAKDGRFLIPTAMEQASAAPIIVVVNWTAGLKK